MKVLLIALILGILFIIAYVIFKNVYKPWSISSVVLEPNDNALNVSKIYTFSPTLAAKNPSHTFTFYVKPVAYDKTTDASVDVQIPIISWTGLFRFAILPGGASKATGTVLQINNTGGTTNNTETIECPMLPLQKWTYVAIAIEGRRVDIFYNGRVAASHLLATIPAYASAMTGTLTSGPPTLTDRANLQGRIGLVAYNNRRMSSEEISIDYVSSCNTRGEPYFGSSVPFIGDLFSCPAGAFCIKPNSPAKPGTVAWYSPFQ